MRAALGLVCVCVCGLVLHSQTHQTLSKVSTATDRRLSIEPETLQMLGFEW